MRKISYEEVKQMQLDILKCIDKFCRDNNVDYSLAYGTLIGAVRHEGYIPWDDDIDIMMPRKDYERFILAFNGAYKHLSVLAPEINGNYYAPYANVFDNRTFLKEGNNGHRGIDIGVKIDIFPIDSVAENMYEYTIDMKRVGKLNHIMYIKRLDNILESDISMMQRLKIVVGKILCSVLPYTYLQKRIRDIATNPSYEDSKFVDNAVFNIYSPIKKTRFCKSILSSYIKVSFEGYKFNAVKDYDIVLRGIYGDYMQLPPEGKRIPHHNFEAYWRECL